MNSSTDAGKEKIDAEAAWLLLKTADKITVIKGKKVASFKPGRNNRDDILQAVMGPSGNLRAPTLRMGRDYLVGFNQELYRHQFAGK